MDVSALAIVWMPTIVLIDARYLRAHHDAIGTSLDLQEQRLELMLGPLSKSVLSS